jgi:hypothetical protein
MESKVVRHSLRNNLKLPLAASSLDRRGTVSGEISNFADFCH